MLNFNAPAFRNPRTFALLICGLLAGCAHGGPQVLQGTTDYPQFNPKASGYFVLHGMTDPAIKIKLSVRWQAHNPDCSVSINWLEGARNQFYAESPIKIEWSGNSFSANVPFDGVLPGRCGWTFEGLAVSGADDHGHPLQPVNGPVLVRLTTEPLPEKDSKGIRDLACKLGAATVPPQGPVVICRDSKLRYPLSVLWIRRDATDVEINFHY